MNWLKIKYQTHSVRCVCVCVLFFFFISIFAKYKRLLMYRQMNGQCFTNIKEERKIKKKPIRCLWVNDCSCVVRPIRNDFDFQSIRCGQCWSVIITLFFRFSSSSFSDFYRKESFNVIVATMLVVIFSNFIEYRMFRRLLFIKRSQFYSLEQEC